MVVAGAMTDAGARPDTVTVGPIAITTAALATRPALQRRSSLSAATAIAARFVISFLLASAGVVYAMTIAASAPAAAGSPHGGAPPPAAVSRVENGDLPRPVREMRDMILAAVATGQLDELIGAIEWNEIRPDFGEPAGDVSWSAHLKSLSADGTGGDVLEIIGRILALPAARLPVGRDFENNALYVWPYLAERPLDNLSPSEADDLGRLLPEAVAREVRAQKRWVWWRLAIGADGTWHVFRKTH